MDKAWFRLPYNSSKYGPSRSALPAYHCVDNSLLVAVQARVGPPNFMPSWKQMLVGKHDLEQVMRKRRRVVVQTVQPKRC
jgi:hypothetical protein